MPDWNVKTGWSATKPSFSNCCAMRCSAQNESGCTYSSGQSAVHSTGVPIRVGCFSGKIERLIYWLRQSGQTIQAASFHVAVSSSGIWIEAPVVEVALDNM